jgi:hypothetical protein
VSGVDISANPEVVKRTVTLDDLKQKLNALENTQKEFEHCKRVEVDGKKKMLIVKTVLPHVEFVELMFIIQIFQIIIEDSNLLLL